VIAEEAGLAVATPSHDGLLAVDPSDQPVVLLHPLRLPCVGPPCAAGPPPRRRAPEAGAGGRRMAAVVGLAASRVSEEGGRVLQANEGAGGATLKGPTQGSHGREERSINEVDCMERLAPQRFNIVCS
jgi:hypothetical protein